MSTNVSRVPLQLLPSKSVYWIATCRLVRESNHAPAVFTLNPAFMLIALLVYQSAPAFSGESDSSDKIRVLDFS